MASTAERSESVRFLPRRPGFPERVLTSGQISKVLALVDDLLRKFPLRKSFLSKPAPDAKTPAAPPSNTSDQEAGK